MSIRMVVVEPYTLVRQGLVQLLAADMEIEVVGEASNGIEAMAIVQELQPNVLLLDLDVPGLDSWVAGRLMELGSPEMQVLAYSVTNQHDSTPDNLPREVSAYIGKGVSAADLIMQIKLGGFEKVATGPVPLSANQLDLLWGIK